MESREAGIAVDSCRPDEVGVCEIGLELVAKARRARLPVAEVPTIWLDRAFGVSTFKLRQWLPRYLRWYLHAYGPARPLDGFELVPLPLKEAKV